MKSKNPLFGPETRNTLLSRLKLCKTRDHQDCCSFRLSEAEEQVRMSPDEMANYFMNHLPEENVKNPQQLVEFIMELAQKEENQEEHSLLQAILETAVQNLMEKVTKEIARFREEAHDLFSVFFSQRQKKFTQLLEEINSKDFEEKIDEALAGFVREQRGNGSSQSKMEEIQKDLLRKIQETEAQIEKKMKDLRKEVEEALNIKEKDAQPVAVSHGQVPMPRFDEQSLKENPKMKMGKGICAGTRGISINPKNPIQVAILDDDGNLHLFDNGKQETIKRMECEVKNSGDYRNSISFSPSGEQLLVSIYNDSSISIYRTNDLVRTHYSSRKDTAEYIFRAHWLDENQVIASFSTPGVIEVIELGNLRAQMKLSPEITKGGSIYDFDVSPSKKELICGGSKDEGGYNYSHHVFKMQMSNGIQKADWSHQQHSDYVNVVKYSHCGQYVLSGGDDKTLILASGKDGAILQKETNWFSSYIYGLVFSPNDQNILVQSYNELVLIDWKKDKKMEKTQEIKKEKLGSSGEIYSLNVFWDLGNARNQNIFIGMESGSVYQLAMKP